MNRIVFVVLICWVSCVTSKNRLENAAALGWIIPTEPIYREVNDSFSLQCTLNMRSAEARWSNSSNLMFFQGDVPVPREQVKILNDSTIELVVEKADPHMNFAYTCKVNDTQGVGIRSVYIGHKPREVKDFKCRAPLWDKHMECTFTPDPNSMAATYELVFYFKPIIQNFTCKLETDDQTNLTKCIINVDTGYRNVNEKYYFILTASNHLGTLSQRFIINHFDVVIPHPPIGCVIEDVTSNSAVLKWSKWYKYDGFSRNFICEVKLLSIFDNNVWRTVNNEGLQLNHRVYTLPLRNLPYAATPYDVRIRMRTNSTETGSDLWSNHTSCLFDTLPRKPDMPPEVAIGAFENSNEHHLFIYWRELDDWQHNARSGFHYNITLIDQHGRIVEHLNTTGGMIDRHHLVDMNYTFVIKSANPEGMSEQASKVFVPARRHRLDKPSIDKLLSDSGKFTLSWKPPSRIYSPITSYTVFWCNTTSNSPNDCNGSINFTSVAADQTTFVLSDVGSTINFAVAANAGRVSSGMVWAACTATHKTDIGKLKTIWISEMDSSQIHLKWKTECVDVAHVGYMIYYCSISSPRTLGCKEPEMKINVTDKTLDHFLLENLHPYVTYKIEIAMYSDTHIGPRSVPLVNTTMEAAPSPPRNLVTERVTNNSISLHWEPPAHINGGKMFYWVFYNGQFLKHDVEEPSTNVTFTLDNLDAFTEYNITVTAETVKPSNSTEPVHARTLVGNPLVIGQPSTNSSNDSKLTIGWNSPSKPSGCVEFYELKVKANQIIVYQQRKTECQLREPICQNRDSSKYEFLVRAVNVDVTGPIKTAFEELSCSDRWTELNNMWPELKRFVAHAECGTSDAIAMQSNGYSWLSELPPNIRLHYGPWSEPLAHWCSMESKNTLALFILVGIAIASGIAMFSYSYVKVKHVLQVKVIIPDGLNDITGSGKPSGFGAVIGPAGIIFTEHHRVDHIITGGSTKEASYSKEQNQCLLPSSSSSGGSIADLSSHEPRSSADYCSNSGCCEDDSTSFYDQEAERQDLHGYSDDTTESIENSHETHQGSSTSSRSAANDDLGSSFGRTNLGTVNHLPIMPVTSMEGKSSQNRSSSAMPITVTSGYVPAPVVNTVKQPISSNGYLQIGALNNGGMMAPLDTMQKSYNAKMAAAAPISGYVTHKQLSDYGQHLK
uniref:Cytokine receptor n=1 Tax=Anopheles coluzzii TaxID=1518534 RepID=A0A6E8WC14_ANOCL|nr:cytokine receptor [Anopheles coluzzii]